MTAPFWHIYYSGTDCIDATDDWHAQSQCFFCPTCSRELFDKRFDVISSIRFDGRPAKNLGFFACSMISIGIIAIKPYEMLPESCQMNMETAPMICNKKPSEHHMIFAPKMPPLIEQFASLDKLIKAEQFEARPPCPECGEPYHPFVRYGNRKYTGNISQLIGNVTDYHGLIITDEIKTEVEQLKLKGIAYEKILLVDPHQT